MQDEGEIYKRRAIQIREAVWAGHDVYINLLQSDDPTCSSIFSLLIEFKDHAKVIFEPLLENAFLEKAQEMQVRKINSLETVFVEGGLLSDQQLLAFKQVKDEINNAT